MKSNSFVLLERVSGIISFTLTFGKCYNENAAFWGLLDNVKKVNHMAKGKEYVSITQFYKAFEDRIERDPVYKNKLLEQIALKQMVMSDDSNVAANSDIESSSFEDLSCRSNLGETIEGS